MKPHRTFDARLIVQLTVLGLLSLCPVMMIVLNGNQAVQAMFTRSMFSRNMGDQDKDPDVVSPRSVADSTRLINASSPATSIASPLRFGVYDPHGDFDACPEFQLRHLYVSWTDFDPAQLRDNLASLQSQGYEPIVTVEPWPMPGSDRPLLPAIANGDYDHIIDGLAGVLSQLTGTVNIAWGHEMDQELVNRYPWSAGEPEQYIAAYRHVVDRVRAKCDVDLRWIWAAVLKPTSIQYWPGDGYVDIIGMPIYSFPQYDLQYHGSIRDFGSTFDEKRRLIASLGKPLMITELGVTGSADFQRYWLQHAFTELGAYADLKAIVFFHATDSEGAWGTSLDTPNWRTDKEVIRGLVAWKMANP